MTAKKKKKFISTRVVYHTALLCTWPLNKCCEMDNLYSDLYSGAQYQVQLRNFFPFFFFFLLQLVKIQWKSFSHVWLFATPWTTQSMEFSRPEYQSGYTGVGSRSFLQRIFPTQGSNPGLLHCRWILYQLSHRRHPRILEWVAYPFSSGSSRPRNWTRIFCVAGRFFTNWAIREAWKYNRNLINFWAVQDIHYRYTKLATSINYS